MRQQFQCPRCNAPVNYGVRFCSQCGQPLVRQQQPPTPPQYQQQFEGPPMQEAIKYAQTRGAQIAAEYGLTPSSANRLAQIVSDGIKNKRGIPGLARDIRREFPDMSKSQSELIAKTETRIALWKGSRERMDAMGVDGKQWYLGSGGKEGNCAACIANAAVGIIPIDQEFPNPEDGIHPGCTCAIAPAMMYTKYEKD